MSSNVGDYDLDIKRGAKVFIGGLHEKTTKEDILVCKCIYVIIIYLEVKVFLGFKTYQILMYLFCRIFFMVVVILDLFGLLEHHQDLDL